MRFSITSVLPLLACSALVAADATTVVNDFDQINSDLEHLDLDVNVVPSGVVGIGPGLQVQVDAVTVDNDLIQTNTDVQASSVFSASDSQNIISAISTVATTSNKTLTDLTTQYGTFGGLAPIVLASLYQLRQDVNTLGLSLYTKLDSSELSAGITLLEGLNHAFDAVIVIYGGTA